MCCVDGGNGMNLSYVHKLLLAADPFSIIRTNFRGWRRDHPKGGKTTQTKRSRARHLTCKQREDIAAGLQDSTMGPISMTAAASDRESVGYEAEIANVLEETGFEVEIDNTRRAAPEQEIPAGVEMVVKDKTVRPAHAFRIVQVFREAGIAIATRVNGLRQKNDTLYITVGRKDAPPLVVLSMAQTAAAWQAKSMALLRQKWKNRFR
jgi:hypothetical protein